jgi:hypothetical protein
MIRCGWVYRVFASFLALWLPLVAGQAGLLQPCALHGAQAAAHGGVHGAMTRGAAMHQIPMHQMPMHQAHAAHQDAAPADGGSAPAHEHHGCSCVACCTLTLTATIADGAPTIESPEQDVRSRTGFSLESLHVALTPAYSRPYTTGPPRA